MTEPANTPPVDDTYERQPPASTRIPKNGEKVLYVMPVGTKDEGKARPATVVNNPITHLANLMVEKGQDDFKGSMPGIVAENGTHVVIGNVPFAAKPQAHAVPGASIPAKPNTYHFAD